MVICQQMSIVNGQKMKEEGMIKIINGFYI